MQKKKKNRKCLPADRVCFCERETQIDAKNCVLYHFYVVNLLINLCAIGDHEKVSFVSLKQLPSNSMSFVVQVKQKDMVTRLDYR